MLDQLGQALEAADAAAVSATMTEDVTLRVAVHDAPFEGRPAAAHILGAVLAGALHSIEITETIDRDRGGGVGGGVGDGGGVGVLMFRAQVATYPGRADGLLVVRSDHDGRLADLTVFLRPLAALQALAEEMGRRLGGPRPDGGA